MLRKHSFLKLLILCSFLFSTFVIYPRAADAETTGTSAKTFATHGQYPALSPDGKTVIVGKGRSNIENDDEPSEVRLEPLDSNMIEISSTNKIIARNPGSTMIKATYKGLVDYINVEVKENHNLRF